MKARAKGGETFLVPGQAEACVLARLGAPGLHVDTKRWCAEVLLIPAGFNAAE